MVEGNSGLEEPESDMTFGELMHHRSKDYLIIYLDIMGYKDFTVRNSKEELYASIEKAYRMLNLIKMKATKNDGSELRFSTKMKMYTDNILLYTELENDEYDMLRCSATLFTFAAFQRMIIKECNLLLRGAITHGKCVIGDYVFGEPIMWAIKAESSKAIWARVLVSEETVKKYIAPELSNMFIPIDEQGNMFLDYLRLTLEFEKKSGKDSYRVLVDHKDDVLRIARNTFNLERFKKINTMNEAVEMLKISQKFHLISLYHNSLCDQYGHPDVKLDVIDDVPPPLCLKIMRS